jgi:hypothetical protein
VRRWIRAGHDPDHFDWLRTQALTWLALLLGRVHGVVHEVELLRRGLDPLCMAFAGAGQCRLIEFDGLHPTHPSQHRQVL